MYKEGGGGGGEGYRRIVDSNTIHILWVYE